MNATLWALRLGLGRGWVDFRRSFISLRDRGPSLPLAVMFVLVVSIYANQIEGSSVPASTLALPGILGAMVAVGGVLGTAHALAADREDGTLLRAKALPHGMVGYFAARLVSVSLDTVLGSAIILGAGMLFFDGLAGVGIVEAVTLGWVLVLGLAATLPWGAVVGSLLRTPRAVGSLALVPFLGLMLASGLFAPIQLLWAWVQALGKVLPIYWLGLGMRSALLPESEVTLEVGESWRTLETVGMLGVWAAVGLLLAPLLLSRMARRESGSSVEARRHRAMQRIG